MFFKSRIVDLYRAPPEHDNAISGFSFLWDLKAVMAQAGTASDPGSDPSMCCFLATSGSGIGATGGADFLRIRVLERERSLVVFFRLKGVL